MPQILTFDQFCATRQIAQKDAAWCSAQKLQLERETIYEYEAGCFLFYNDGGGAHLIIGNVGWEAAGPEELEEQLYNDVYLPLMGVQKAVEVVPA